MSHTPLPADRRHAWRLAALAGAAAALAVGGLAAVALVRSPARPAFAGTNRGTWLFHCHVNDHITAGMLTRYRVG